MTIDIVSIILMAVTVFGSVWIVIKKTDMYGDLTWIEAWAEDVRKDVYALNDAIAATKDGSTEAELRELQKAAIAIKDDLMSLFQKYDTD